MIRVITNYPVALDSPDHLHPRGAIRDNHINLTFNDRLNELYPKDLSVLDLGCAGGGMVKTLVDQGHLAVGIEGSDWCKKNRALEWAHLTNRNLFTADISKPFWVEECLTSPFGEWWFRTRFKVITLWEVIEHISEDDLDTLFMNIRNHLSVDDGIVVMSVSPNEEVVDGARLHQTVHDQGWWSGRLAGAGFHDSGLGGKFSDCMVRGPLDAPGSFHFVLTCIRQYIGNWSTEGIHSGSERETCGDNIRSRDQGIRVGQGREHSGDNQTMSDTVSDDGPPPGFIPAPIHPMDDISPDPTQGGDPLPITEVTVPDPEVVAGGDGEDVAPTKIVVPEGSEVIGDPPVAIIVNGDPRDVHIIPPPQDDHPLAMLGGPYKIICDHIRAMEKKLNIEGWWK